MITFNEIINNKEYRERVIKFFRLPIRLSVSKEKFLSDLEFIKEYDLHKYEEIITFTENDFNKVVREQKTDEPDFTMEDIIEPIVEEIAEMEEWKNFLEQDYSNTLGDYKGITNTHQFYKVENDGKCFISFDLKSANWQSLQTITGIKDSYEDLIVKHTDNLIPSKSKTVRTKITALLNAKKIMDYNKHLLNINKESIVEELRSLTDIDLTNEIPFAFYADEFLIEVDKGTMSKLNSLNLNEIEDSIAERVGIEVHLTPFNLRWMGINKGCVKVYKDGYEFLNLSKDIVLIINKLIHDIPVNEVDFEGIKLKDESRIEFLSRLNKVAQEYI